jgi:hypothetical protein
MAHVRLDRLLRQEEAVSDLPVYESLGDQLQDFELPRRRLLLQLGERSREGNDLSRASPSARRGRLETAAVVDIARQDLLTLGRVHGLGIGVPENPLYPSPRVILRAPSGLKRAAALRRAPLVPARRSVLLLSAAAGQT